MQFYTHNDKPINANGTCLVGYINVSYFDLKNVFGDPFGGDQYKTDVEWEIEFEDGTVATIYNYKDGISYLGKIHGVPKSKIKEWHVGGHNSKALEHVCAVLIANGRLEEDDQRVRFFRIAR